MVFSLAKSITSSEIREVIALDSLTKLTMAVEYGLENKHLLEDVFSSIMFLGPPGVGKSVLQHLGLKDAMELLRTYTGRSVDIRKISLRITHEEASKIVNEVIAGRVAPYVHIYLPQTKIWHLEGTPSPMDSFVEVAGRKIPYNLWRLDPFIIPLLDYTDVVKDVNKLVTPLLVIDEFNMGRREVREALFQLARSAELGRAKLNPLTIITLVGNTPETNIYAEQSLPAPLLNRSARYIVSRADTEGWLAYMNEVYGNKWLKEVGGFLVLNSKYLYQYNPNRPESMVTPRTWTHLATRLYTIQVMGRHVGYTLTGSEKYRFMNKIINSYLPKDIAVEFSSFLRNVQRYNIMEVIKNPQLLEDMDRNAVAYLLVSITSSLMHEYRQADNNKRERILRKLVELYEHGSKVIGNEALGIIITSLPAPVRIAFSNMLNTEKRESLQRISRKVREYEEALGA